jgi:hypothetical protein
LKDKTQGSYCGDGVDAGRDLAAALLLDLGDLTLLASLIYHE